MNIKIHSNQYRWWYYWRPRRLTLACNPPIYRWLFWVWGGHEWRESALDFSLFTLFLIAFFVLDIVLLAYYFTGAVWH